jgi:hypothetical protein
MASLEPADTYIRDRVSNGASYAEIASELQQFSSTGSRGLSLRSVRRYCNTNGMRSCTVATTEMTELVLLSQMWPG